MNPPYRLIPKAILLELFLHEVTSFSKDVTGALSGCFRGGFVNVSFLFVSKRKENFQRCEDPFFDNLITSKGASVNSSLWKRVIAFERSRAASGCGIIWGDADRNKQEGI